MPYVICSKNENFKQKKYFTHPKFYVSSYNGTRLFSGFRVGLGFKNPNPTPEPTYPKKSGSQPETRTQIPENIGFPTRNPT